MRDAQVKAIRRGDVRLGTLTAEMMAGHEVLRSALGALDVMRRTPATVRLTVAALEREVVRCRGLLLEQELREMVKAARVTRVEPVLRYFGWDGRGGSTLQEAGDEVALTRERVRQLAVKVETLVLPRTFAPALDRALSCVSSLMDAEQAERTWLARGITESYFRAEGVIRAAEMLGRRTDLSVIDLGGERVICDSKAGMAVAQLRDIAERGCARWTVMSLLDLESKCRALGHATDFDLRRIVERIPGSVWLDKEAGWFWIPRPRSRLLNHVRKILAAAPRITLGELRAGVARHYRTQGFAPPKKVLAALCSAVGGYKVDGDIVVADPPLDANKILSDAEEAMVGVLKEAGGVIGGAEFERRCVAAGINRNTYTQYLTYSPVIARLAQGVYALRGVEVAPGVVDSLRPTPSRRRGQVLQDYGWTESGDVWLGYRLSESTVASGVVSLPSRMSKFLEPEYALEGEEEERLGTLHCKDHQAWGLSPLIARRGLEAGDFLMLTFDRKARTVHVVFGSEEPWLASAAEMPCFDEEDEDEGRGAEGEP